MVVNKTPRSQNAHWLTWSHALPHPCDVGFLGLWLHLFTVLIVINYLNNVWSCFCYL